MAGCLVVGIGGCSRSGKSTLARALLHSNSNMHNVRTVVISQDDFFCKTGVPQHHLGYQQPGPRWNNRETPRSLEMDKFINAIVEAREKSITVKEEEEEDGGINIVNLIIVEGYLLFCDWRVVDLLDIKIFLDLPMHSARARRMHTNPCSAAYFDKVLWPHYLMNHVGILCPASYSAGERAPSNNLCHLYHHIDASLDQSTVLELCYAHISRRLPSVHVVDVDVDVDDEEKILDNALELPAISRSTGLSCVLAVSGFSPFQSDHFDMMKAAKGVMERLGVKVLCGVFVLHPDQPQHDNANNATFQQRLQAGRQAVDCTDQAEWLSVDSVPWQSSCDYLFETKWKLEKTMLINVRLSGDFKAPSESPVLDLVFRKPTEQSSSPNTLIF